MIKKRAGSKVAEERLRAAFTRNEALDLRTGHRDQDDPSGGMDWTPERQVRADVIAELARGGNDHGTSALTLAGVRIVGAFELRHATITKALIMKDCYFDETADFSEASAVSLCLARSHLPSLACYGLQVERDIDFNGIDSGHIDVFGARVGGRLWLQSAHLHGPRDGWALNAPDLVVDGGMYCRGVEADGGINIYGATIGSTLELREANLANPGGTALRASGLTVRFDMDCSACTAAGAVDLFGAKVGGQLWLGAAHLTGRDSGFALNAPLLKVDGGMYCIADFSATGGVNPFGATIGSTLEFDEASLINPGGVALRAAGCTVQADTTFTRGFSAVGAIELPGAQIGGQLILTDATFTDTVADLRKADIRVLSAAPSSWPRRIRLGELTYTAVEPNLPAREWLAWLRRDPDGYQPQPYEQLAAYYRRVGQDEQARTVLLARQRQRRHRLRLPARAWGHVQDAAVGYGYRQARAAAWLALLLAITAAYFAANPPRPTSPGTAQFQPVIYAFHTVIPVLNLTQQQAYVPTGAGLWVSWIVSLAGWILATTVIAGITRILTRS
jgi:hypothetical protein